MIGYPSARRYAELVERLTGDQELVPPGLLLEVDRPEWSVMKNEVPIVGWRTDAAVAGQFSSVGIVNAQTGGRDRLTVIKKVIIINQTAGVLVYRVGMQANISADAASGVASRDLRRLTVMSAIVDRTAAGQLLPSVQGLPVPPNSFIVIDADWMLSFTSLGRSMLVVEGDVVNQLVRAGFFGYERALLPEESVLD